MCSWPLLNIVRAGQEIVQFHASGPTASVRWEGTGGSACVCNLARFEETLAARVTVAVL